MSSGKTGTLYPDTHHWELVNIVTGQNGVEEFNVQNAVLIGLRQMNAFSQELPHDLYDTIHRNVIILIDSKKTFQSRGCESV
jgi:hypothetical protein